MTLRQFQEMAIPYLIELFPTMADKLSTGTQRALWFSCFDALELDSWKVLCEMYAMDNDRRPTINSLRRYLPDAKPETADVYARPGAYKIFEYDSFEDDAERIGLEELHTILAPAYARINERMAQHERRDQRAGLPRS